MKIKKAVKFLPKGRKAVAWICIILASIVVLAFVIVDTTVLGRMMHSFKDPEDREYFANASEAAGGGATGGKASAGSAKTTTDDNKPPYTHLTSAVMVAPEEATKRVSVTKDSSQCKDSCTYDDKCVAYTFDGLKEKCSLLYDITGYVRNKDGLFTMSGGIKHRPFIGEHQSDRKYMRFEGMELPPDGVGKLATHQFIKNVNACKTKCLEHSDINSKCMAFEYDFKTKACTLNGEVAGKMVPRADKDVYLLIN